VENKQHIVTYRVEKEEEGLLREFLLQHKRISRKSLSKVKYDGTLRVNGEEVTVRANVKEDDLVEVVFPVEEGSPYLIPENVPLHILYEDDHILIINKQAGLCVHPTFSQKSGTLANGVMYHWQKKGWQRTFHAVNRLDRDTSGIVLLAQNRFSHQQLSIQQKSNQLERKYYAWVHGQVEADEGVIEAPIGRKEDSIITREVRSDGQFAKTYFKVIKRFPTYTWVELKLATGRTHQIRVHMDYMGHPLLGDDMYGGERQLISRQALHAYYTSFKHPETGENITFQADLPQDLQELITH
jgi:23S rRNA pseudouridine1911/1915/1917 synthase